MPAAPASTASADLLGRLQRLAGASAGAPVDYAPAGRRLRVVYHGAAIRTAFDRALAGVRAPDAHAEPDATFHVIDLGELGNCVPAPQLARGGPLKQGEIAELSTPELRVFWESEVRTLSVWDRANRTGYYAAFDGAALPCYKRAAPLRLLTNLWLSEQGVQLAHSSAVERDGRGILLAGVGGSGKSTTALLALRAGWGYLSDDWCLVEPGEAPAVHQAYCSCKLRPDSYAWFPDLHEAFSNNDRLDEEKATLFLPESPLGEGLRRSVPLAAIVLPRVQPGVAETTFRPATAGDCWKAIAPPTISCIPGAGPRAALLLGQLAKQVPSFHLDLGADHDGVVRALGDVLDAVA